MRIMTVDAAQLRIATAAHRIGVLHRVPRRHAGRILWTSPRVAAPARPIDVFVSPSKIERSTLVLGIEVGAAWEEFGRNLAAAFNVLATAQMASFAAYAEAHSVFRCFPIRHGVSHYVSVLHVGRLRIGLQQASHLGSPV